MFNLPHGKISIWGGQFNNHVHCKEPSAIESTVIVGAFRDHYISSATHDNNDILDPPKCHPGTRMSLLNQLSNWVKDPSSLVYMSWLHGPAGAGKSAVARSLAAVLQTEGLLAGSFFFYHADSTRNLEKPFVVTLAQQLAFYIPETQPYIANCLIRDPAIFSRSFETQFEELIVNPIIQLCSSTHRLPSIRPALIIIDGLDECKDPKARYLILKTLRDSFPQLQGWLKFLVASRPEHDIETFFEITTHSMEERLNLIDLLSDIRAHEDVHLYLCDQFERIKQEHPLRATFNLEWPPSHAIEILVEKSSGHFIYASTVIKYIENAYDRPQKCLDDIIHVRESSLNPYGELDALYLNILSSSKVDRKLLVDILSAALVCDSIEDTIVYYKAPKDIAKHDRFVESVLLLEPGTVQLALLDLKSLIGLGQSSCIPPQLIHSKYNSDIPHLHIQHIKFWHKSFADFLFDETRSKEFHVHSGLAYTAVAKGCLQLLSVNCKLMEKYWPEEQGLWLRLTYHHSLAWSCARGVSDPDLNKAMMNYNICDILRIQSFECRWKEFTRHESLIDYFHILRAHLSSFGKAPAFEGTDVYKQLLQQFQRQIRTELEIWAPQGSKLMDALQTSITATGIDWPKLTTSLECKNRSFFRQVVVSNLTGVVQWPYLLEWLFDRNTFRNSNVNAKDLLICDTFVHIAS